MASKTRDILVTGGAGYVGSALAPRLLEQGHTVTILDLYLFGHDVLDGVAHHPRLIQIKGDLRHPEVVEKAVAGCDTVIHLACISNDPSFELDPVLGKSINYDAFRPLVRASKRAGVERFIYASSSSVYGIKSEPEVTEDLPLEPLTDYSKFKALCEDVLAEEREPGFATMVVRPATVCGYAPRQRLDVIVNILTNHAVTNRRIKVFGGDQLRPNIHIDDMVSFYELALDLPDAQIDGKIFNAGYDNAPVRDLAETVKRVVEQDNELGGTIEMDVVPTDDNRSYHVSSTKAAEELGFTPKKTIEDAIRDLVAAFKDGRLTDTMDDNRYYNIKTMQALELK
ncbi:MAG: NAD-dependent epimerase/dehydratase family protein [Hyphomicrobiales bacterium]|nr:NAD-dependent epimerase/dehydratase family protein [Hyphomicrobiales bacterium]